VMIPLTVFFKHKFETMTGVATRANFQKCGDSLPSPHYLVWNYIESENPDFHRPEFFGEVEFE
jgi:Carbohydrate-binding family 9